LNNYIAEISGGLGEAKEICCRLEGELAHVKSSAKEHTMLLGSIKMGTLNLYKQLCEKLHQTPNVTFQTKTNSIQVAIIKFQLRSKNLKSFIFVGLLDRHERLRGSVGVHEKDNERNQ